MVDKILVYRNIGKVVEQRDGVLNVPLLSDADLTKSLASNGYAVVRAARKGHAFRPDSNMVFIMFAENTDRIAKSDRFLSTWDSIKPDPSDNVIIVTYTQPSHYIEAALNNKRKNNPRMYIELVLSFKLAFNFPATSVYEKQEVADPEEIKEFREGQRTDLAFKKITADDTGAIWTGARPGDHVKVTGRSHVAGYRIEYLECIKA